MFRSGSGSSFMKPSGGGGPTRIRFCLSQIKMLARMEILTFWMLSACLVFFLLNMTPFFAYLGMAVLFGQAYVMAHGGRLHYIAEVKSVNGQADLHRAGLSGRSEVWLVLPAWGFFWGASR